MLEAQLSKHYQRARELLALGREGKMTHESAA